VTGLRPRRALADLFMGAPFFLTFFMVSLELPDFVQVSVNPTRHRA